MFGDQCVYDFAKRPLIKDYGFYPSPYEKESVQSFIFLKNYLFVFFVLLKNFDGPKGDVPTKQPFSM